jgi:hypothetical protein
MSWEVSAGFSIVIAVPLFASYDLLRHIAPATHQGAEPLCSSADPPLRMIQLKRGNDSQAPTFCSARYHTTQREIQALKHRGLLGYVLTERGFLDIHIGMRATSIGFCHFGQGSQPCRARLSNTPLSDDHTFSVIGGIVSSGSRTAEERRTTLCGC